MMCNNAWGTPLPPLPGRRFRWVWRVFSVNPRKYSGDVGRRYSDASWPEHWSLELSYSLNPGLERGFSLKRMQVYPRRTSRGTGVACLARRS